MRIGLNIVRAQEVMSHTSFIITASDELASAIRKALTGEASPGSVRSAAEAVMAKWDSIKPEAPENMAKGEEVLWAAVWAAQHVGDMEHWKDGSAHRELMPLLASLEGKAALPNGWSAQRP